MTGFAQRLQGLRLKFDRARNNPFFTFGLPMILLMVVGSVGLREFTSTRYEKHEIDVSKVTKEQLSALEKNKRVFNIEEEYKRLQSMDTEKWEQQRVPRPWEK
eukprot:comp5458_c0_seq1/m.1413 comp5458_c0_seq1/g.1413  ORF comp5458_c0_seq1/g.1413 comp5458_c0_seq1/m.1413 type:complete len:103 (-) comp5458_c0_seq1:220-528(-)